MVDARRVQPGQACLFQGKLARRKKGGSDSDREFIPSDRSGYVHAEENALLKAGAIEKDKTMFITHTPCVMCAKRAINSGVARVYCRQPNQRGDAMGIDVLRAAGKQVVWWHEQRA